MITDFCKYLLKHAPFTDFNPAQIATAEIIVVIPVYLEYNLVLTLQSLLNCKPVDENIAVLLVVNACENSIDSVIAQQKRTIEEINIFVNNNRRSSFNFYVLEAFQLPKKHFGAGLARKIGMDMAVQHFYSTENKNGIIVSLDADSTVDPNYFTSISSYFKKKKHQSCSIYFEHPVSGTDFQQEIYDAITQYELHLRYYVECLRMIGFPYSYHTIGSCFALKAGAYVKVGGMNRRQGGEEFYFIQKLIQLGGHGELNHTVVHPSPRISNRVPFGTGPSIKSIVEGGAGEYPTYNLQGFIDLKVLFDDVESYYQVTEDQYQSQIINLPGRLRSFLLNSGFWEELESLNQNCSDTNVFKKRFYHVFNAFKLVKYINYIHEHFLEKVPVFDASMELLQQLGYQTDDFFEDIELLEKLRHIQKCR